MQSLATTPSVADEGYLTLQLRHPCASPRTVRVRTQELLFGTGAACNFRLRGEGVAERHCRITRTSDGQFLHTLDGQVLVNGAPTQEKALRPGDRLQVGPFELVLLEIASAAVSAKPDDVSDEARCRPDPPPGELVSAPSSDFASAGDSEPKLGNELAIATLARINRLIRRLDELETQRAAAHEQQARWLDEIERLSQINANRELEDRQRFESLQALVSRQGNEWTMLRRDIAELKQEWTNASLQVSGILSNLGAVHQQWREFQRSCQAEVLELQQRLQELTEHAAAWQYEQQQQIQRELREFQRAIDDSRDQAQARLHELDLLLKELRNEQAAFAEERHRWQSERRNWIRPGGGRGALDYERAQLRLAEIRAERESLELQCRQHLAERHGLDALMSENTDTLPEATPVPESPDSATEKVPMTATGQTAPSAAPGMELAADETPAASSESLEDQRWRAVLESPSASPAVMQEVACGPPAIGTADAVSDWADTKATPASDPDTGDEVHRYLADLLRRTGNTNAVDENAEGQPAPAGRPLPASPSAAPVPAVVVPELSNVPERSSTLDITALRGLANESTRSALDAHARLCQFQAARTQLIVVLVAIFTAVGLWWFNQGHVYTLAGVVLAIIVAVIWSFRYAVLSRRLKATFAEAAAMAAAAKAVPGGMADASAPNGETAPAAAADKK